ncbi:nuclear transport factor 2 family protein [uncultured Ruegeria sp.]|uniref:nuclear transport factor 2 family protein n=1 Tax=uncultured Ruegeria sp. TaxID=259304 RepID=UPI00261006F7|nr:nuclear transport factor 2 family protein [uncultured Ruegeria sp.]
MSVDLQSAKSLVQAYSTARDKGAPGAETAAACAEYLSPEHTYRGMRPFYEVEGPETLADTVWTPLKNAMSAIQRRPDIFFASNADLDPGTGTWVVEMGNFLCDFTKDWLGIPAIGKTVYLPFATMSRVRDGAVVETVEFLDILAVLTQTGWNPFAQHQTGSMMMSPGPMTHDGLLNDPQSSDLTEKTYDLTHAMLTDLALSYTSPGDHLVRFWSADMTWFGPTGIGASLSIPGYQRGHTLPFEAKQDVVKIHDWELALAEGNFAAFMWWPCLTLRNTGDYLGAPANDVAAEMRVVDIYRRDGDKLAENWIFIDILHFLAEQGVDLLANTGETE